jgi:hypothetical protein
MQRGIVPSVIIRFCAQDAIEWIDGKNVLPEDHVTNLQRPDAEPIIRDIRRIAESEAKVC